MYRLPNLLIVGVQKGATTYSHKILSSSPEILGSSVKELNFFNKNSCTTQEAQSQYINNFKCGPQRYYMESTPHYFRLPHEAGTQVAGITQDVAGSIAHILPREDRKLIVILRNPVERAISATKHHISMGRLPETEIVDTIYDRLGIVNRGFYYRILSHWRAIFGDDLGVFYFDDLLEHPEKFFGSICDFIDIDKEFLEIAAPHELVNTSKSVAASKGVPEAKYICVSVVNELIDIYREDIELLFELESISYPGWRDIGEIADNLNMSLVP